MALYTIQTTILFSYMEEPFSSFRTVICTIQIKITLKWSQIFQSLKLKIKCQSGTVIRNTFYILLQLDFGLVTVYYEQLSPPQIILKRALRSGEAPLVYGQFNDDNIFV